MQYPLGSFWYTICTKPYQELKVRDHLISKDIEAFVPLKKLTLLQKNGIIRGNQKHRKTYRTLPLFTRYVIAYTDLDTVIANALTAYYVINTTPGVIGLMGCDNKALVMDDACITPLLEILDSDFYWKEPILQLETDPFNIGDPIEITEGAFAGYHGEYRGRYNNETIEVFNSQFYRLTGKLLKISNGTIRLLGEE